MGEQSTGVKYRLDAETDVASIQNPADVSELEQIAELVGKPLLYNCSGDSPVLSLDRAEALGFDIAMFPRMSTLPTTPSYSIGLGNFD